MGNKCKWHIEKKLGYVGWHNKSARLRRQGKHQKQCLQCGLYFWPDEFGEPPKGIKI